MLDNNPSSITESCEFVEEDEEEDGGAKASCEYVEDESQSCEFVESKETLSSDRRGYSYGWIAPIGGRSKIFEDDAEYF